jgi:exosome complex component RRP4
LIHVQNKELVVPGQLLAEGKYAPGYGTFREGEQVYASIMGLADIGEDYVRIIPLKGRYMPAREDIVIGVVIDSHHAGWIVDINSPYTGTLLVSDFLQRKVDLQREDVDKYLTISDVAALCVKEVDERMDILLEAGRPGLGRIKGGKLIDITPVKIPRVLGKKGSMLEILQKVGGCRVLVGRNGRIMVWGDDDRKVNAVVEAIFTIEREAHTSGLTDRIRLMLEKSKSEVS